jgi:hypothetical protein
MLNFEDPIYIHQWEVACDPDHPVAYDFDTSSFGGVLFMILWILYAAFFVVLIVNDIVGSL